MPARRALLLAGLLLFVSALAAAVPAVGGVVVFGDAALLLALLLDWRAAAATPLAASRHWPPMLTQGTECEMVLEVATSSRRGVVVWLREGLHPALCDGPRRARRILGGSRPAAFRISLLPTRRGSWDTAPLTARVLGPLGLAWAQRDLLRGVPCRVYPQIRWEGRVGRLLELAHRRELGQSPRGPAGLGTEPYALREYLPGDPPSRIHWKATARHGRPISREDTWERGHRVVLVLDVARAMRSMDHNRSKLDYALAAALALLRVATARGGRVTMLAFSDRIERTLAVRSSGHGAALAYRTFYDIDARLAEPAYDLAADAVMRSEPRRATVVMFTSVVDLASAELLKASLARLRQRHVVLLVNLEDPDLGRLAFGMPGSTREAFAKVSALEILLANRRLSRGLRHGGVRVVGTSADRLALDVLDAYLALIEPRIHAGARARAASAG